MKIDVPAVIIWLGSIALAFALLLRGHSPYADGLVRIAIVVVVLATGYRICTRGRS